MVVGLVLVLRPADPRTIAQKLHFDAGGADEAAAPLREIVCRPGVLTALVAAIASFAGMVSVMNLTGYLVIDHGHHQSDVFTVISLHIVGMYALVLVIGQVVDAVGRRPGQVAGLLLMGVSTLALAWFESVFWVSASLFLLGLGWNVSYVAAVTELADRALPAERGQADRADRPALELHRRGAPPRRRPLQAQVEALALIATAFVVLLRQSGLLPDPPPALPCAPSSVK